MGALEYETIKMKDVTAIYKIENGKLLFADGKTVSFDYSIQQELNFPGVIVVLLNIPTGEIFNENVFGVSFDGEVLWQVAPQRYLGDDSPYTGMNYEDGKAGLYNWDSTLYVVEPMTGELISKRFVNRTYAVETLFNKSLLKIKDLRKFFAQK